MIEISRTKSPYVYRVNPWNPRVLDRKVNRHGARWESFRTFDSAEEAQAAILTIEREVKK